MESYQTAGVLISIFGIIAGIAVSFAIMPVGLLMFVINVFTLVMSAAIKTGGKGLGVTLIVLGIIGNIFLIIPGIMAIRYKPKVGQKFELTK